MSDDGWAAAAGLEPSSSRTMTSGVCVERNGDTGVLGFRLPLLGEIVEIEKDPQCFGTWSSSHTSHGYQPLPFTSRVFSSVQALQLHVNVACLLLEGFALALTQGLSTVKSTQRSFDCLLVAFSDENDFTAEIISEALLDCFAPLDFPFLLLEEEEAAAFRKKKSIEPLAGLFFLDDVCCC